MSSLPDFLQPLEYYTTPFPRAAMEAAIERREESIPHLLKALKWAVKNPDEANEAEPVYTLHVYAMYLLAFFRERRALPLIIELFHLDGYEELTGDIVITGLPRLLASTCGDDITPITALVEDATADDMVRSAAVEALGVLLHCGVRSRQEICDYFKDVIERSGESAESFGDSIVAVCVDLRLSEVMDGIRTLYGTIGELMVDPFEEVEEAIAEPLDPREPGLQIYRLIEDPVTDLEILAAYEESAARESYEPTLPGLDYLEPEEPGIPHVRETPKVGRNDLCPCGSGKKYKKCCGKTAEE